MRNRIIMAAFEEINVRGFKFTMNDLTKRLSISKSSLYEQFSSKNELISSVLNCILEDMKQQEDAIYQNDTLLGMEKFKAVLVVTPKVFGPIKDQLYDDLRNSFPSEWQRVRDFNQHRLDRVNALLIEQIESGAIRPVNLNVLRQLIIAGMNQLASYRFLAENNMTYSDAVAAMSDLLTYGLTVQPHDPSKY